MDETVMTLRAIKNSAAVLLMMMVYNRPVGRDEVVRVLDVSEKTAAAMLASLETAGLARRQSHQGGYVLNSEKLSLLASKVEIFHHPKIEVEDSINLIQDDSTTRKVEKIHLRTSDRFGVTVPQLLENSDKVFDSKVIPNGLPVEDLNPDVVLAWIAQVYAGMRRLNRPAAVVYARLREGVQPDDRYMLDPISALPAKFLNAIGIEAPEPEPQVIDSWGISAEVSPEEVAEAAQMFDDTSIDTPLPDGRTPRQVWQAFVEGLRDDFECIPSASFETWLEPARPVSFADGVFIILAHNHFSAQWLERNWEKIGDGFPYAVKFVAGG